MIVLVYKTEYGHQASDVLLVQETRTQIAETKPITWRLYH